MSPAAASRSRSSRPVFRASTAYWRFATRSRSFPIPTPSGRTIAPPRDASWRSPARARTTRSTRERSRASTTTPASSAADRRSRLAARHRVDVLHFARQRHGLPALAAVLRAEHLAVVARADIDLFGVTLMEADRHDRAVHLDLVEALPALAAVLAPVDRAVVARGGDRERGVERVRLGR